MKCFFLIALLITGATVTAQTQNNPIRISNDWGELPQLDSLPANFKGPIWFQDTVTPRLFYKTCYGADRRALYSTAKKATAKKKQTAKAKPKAVKK